MQSQPGNPAKRQSLTISSALGSGITDLTMSGGDSSLLILGAAGNAYTGKTTVNSGTLRTLTDTSLPDTTQLFLADDGNDVGNNYGTKVHLNFGGTDTISALYFDGIQQAEGTWGSSASGATHINDDWFSGVGMLLVAPAQIPGDFDGDGDVDGVDIAELFSNFNGPGGGVPTNPDTDLDNDGDCDGVDVATLFGAFTGPLSPASVPEPGSVAALLTLGAVPFARRRRKESSGVE